MLLEAPNATKVSVYAKGTGGWDSLVSNLSDDHAFYGGFCAKVTGLPILFLFFLQGDSMNPIKRGKTRMVKLGVFSALDGALGEVILEGLGECTKDNVLEQIDFAAGGVGKDNIEF